METVWQDVRYAARSLRRTPAFTTAAVLTLALGIGATTAIFSVVNAVLLESLPYPDSTRIVMLVTSTPDGPVPVDTWDRFEAWRQHVDVLDDVSAYRVVGVNLTAGTEAEQVLALQVTPGFFHLFGARLDAGRAFTVDEHRGTDTRPVLVSRRLVQRRFSGDPTVVGRAVSVNGVPHLVAGILGTASAFDTLPFVPQVPGVDLVVPLPANDEGAPVRYLVGAGRLKPNTAISQADAQARAAASAFRREFPTQLDREETFVVEPLADAVVGGVRRPLLILLGVVGFVLLIACVNVANLLLIRGSVRRRDIAVRTALGADTARIIRQLLVECGLLALGAGSLALMGSMLAVRVVFAINPQHLPRLADPGSVATDWRVFLFTAVISLLTAAACGLLPALQIGRADLRASCDERRAGTAPDRRRSRSGLLVVETAVTLMLLIGSGLLIRTFVAVRSIQPGFDASGILNVPMVLAGQRFENTAGVAQVVQEGTTRLRRIPGVVQATAGCCPPMLGRYQLPFIIPGRQLNGPSHGVGGWVNVSPGYFDVFKMPVVRGRTFTELDIGSAPGVVVINETMARRYWPGGDPLNDRLLIGQGFRPAEEPVRTIVGIVGDVRDGGLEGEPVPMIYVPTAQMPDDYTALHARVPLLWFIRTETDIDSLAPIIERELREASGGVPVATTMIRSMDQVMSESRATSDLQTALMTAFACIALLLAAVGIYGVTAYSVQQRTREIGIRIAVGAQLRQVRHLVLAQGMAVTVLGLALGIICAIGLSRVLAGLLFGVTPHDPIVFVAAPMVLGSVAFAALWLPARRAARVDPIAALRTE